MLVKLSCIDCHVRNNSSFACLNEKDTTELDRKKTAAFYKKGQVIFHAGFRPTGIYCLNKGRIKISKIGIDGKEQIVRFVTEGGLLGIRALVSGRDYSASATALEDSIVCFIYKRNFFKFSIKYPEISQNLMVSLSQLLEEAEDKMTSLAQKPVRERLAESLLILHNVFSSGCKEKKYRDNPLISLSRSDLANLVGTATETVIRLLADFRDENLLSIQGRKIILKNINGLKKLANQSD